MKKYIAMILLSMMVFGIVGCTGNAALVLSINENLEHKNPEPENQRGSEMESESVTVLESNRTNKEDIKILEKNLPVHKGKINYSMKTDKKVVALTFDDGPDTLFTAQILKVLEAYNVKATFFVIGSNAAKYPYIIKEIHGKGHAIGNHSWSHKRFTKLKEEQIKEEIMKTQDLLEEILEEYIPIVRPPYGSAKTKELEIVNEQGYDVVNWSVDTKDWAGTSLDGMLGYIHRQLKPGGIILMHSAGNVKNTVRFLPQIIEAIQKKGYEFVTVPELLNIPQ